MGAQYSFNKGTKHLKKDYKMLASMKVAAATASAAVMHTGYTNIQEKQKVQDSWKQFHEEREQRSPAKKINQLKSCNKNERSSIPKEIPALNNSKAIIQHQLGQSPGWKRKGLQGEPGQQCFVGKKISEK